MCVLLSKLGEPPVSARSFTKQMWCGFWWRDVWKEVAVWGGRPTVARRGCSGGWMGARQALAGPEEERQIKLQGTNQPFLKNKWLETELYPSLYFYFYFFKLKNRSLVDESIIVLVPGVQYCRTQLHGMYTHTCHTGCFTRQQCVRTPLLNRVTAEQRLCLDFTRRSTAR